VRVELPLDPHRAVNDILALGTAAGGPVMADTTDRWVAARGRRIFCRVYRPRTDRPLPTLMYFHGGGCVWPSVDTHDRLAREYAAAGEVAVVSVDYALSPEAKFPQAVEECAAVTRYVAAHGAEWGLDPSSLLVGGDSAGGNLALATALLPSAARHRRPGTARHRRGLSGLRQCPGHRELPGIRHPPRPDARADEPLRFPS
jgi:acetyl esterase